MMKTQQDLSVLVSIKLKQAREDLGLTQQQVADLLKRPQSYVSRCEKGVKKLDIQELKEFCVIYKKQLSFFLEE